MDTFTITCDCGTEMQFRVPSSLGINLTTCPACGKSVDLQPRPQHGTGDSPCPQYGITPFRGGDYS